MNKSILYSRIIQSATLALLLGLCGCATMMKGCQDPDANESDIPWNVPQTWEETPGIPGLNQGR